MKLRAEIKNGKIVFQNEEWVEQALWKLNNKNVIVDIDQVKSKRSLNQNSYYWLCLSVISADTGNDTDTLHRLFRGKFLPKKVQEWKGKKYEMPLSTTELTKGQFVEYMMNISAEVADMGIILPDPSLYGSDL